MLPNTSAAPEPIPLATSTVLFKTVLPASVTFFPNSDRVAFADSAVLFKDYRSVLSMFSHCLIKD